MDLVSLRTFYEAESQMRRLLHLHWHNVPNHRPPSHGGFSQELQTLLIENNRKSRERKPTMFRKLKRWFAGLGIDLARSHAKKSLTTNKPIKDALHMVNKAIQSRFTVEGDGKQKALQYAKDLMSLAHAYVDAYGDKDTPTSISDAELAALDIMWDSIIEKYVPPERIAEWIDFAFDYADELVKKSL